MPIKVLTKEIAAEVGAYSDFESATLIETLLSGHVTDGRKVEIFRAALGAPYFEIAIDGVDQRLRLNLLETLTGLCDELAAMYPKPEKDGE